MGQIRLPSGRLAIGDPVLGMAAGRNPYIQMSPGSYAVALTRMICLDKEHLEIPAYLSIIVDPKGLDLRREQQKDSAEIGDYYGVPPQNLNYFGLSLEGRFEELEDDGTEALLSRSGVIALVDEDAFFRRMPNQIQDGENWFNRFFSSNADSNWLHTLDGDEHLEPGIANLTLPAGPDDWIEGGPSTIALAQMLSSGDALILMEHHLLTGSLVAIHVELGLMAALFQS